MLDRFKAVVMAIKLLKFPMLKHSCATSIQKSINFARTFFFTFFCEWQ